MNQSATSQKLAKGIGSSLLIGSLVWAAFLGYGAVALRGQEGNSGYDVAIGPLLLHHISKQQTADGFTASFSFESGLLWYGLFWIALGAVAGLLATYAHKDSDKAV
jgi:hypothetical protein